MGGMTGSLLLLLWAGVSVSTMVDLQKRIFNGENCKDYERLYHVKLDIQIPNVGTGFCGGSLINDWWILTAAHCWKQGWTITAAKGHPAVLFQRNQLSINNRNIHQHPTADIMLLKLTTPATRYHRIDLPDCRNFPTPKNVMVQIAGHGDKYAASDKTRIISPADHLQCADIEAIPCPRVNQNQYDQWFCGKTTNTDNPVGVCHGDSGGGVVYDGKIYGVIVSVDDPTKVCTGPDKFVGVCGHMQWIQDTIKPPSRIDKLKDCFGCG